VGFFFFENNCCLIVIFFLEVPFFNKHEVVYVSTTHFFHSVSYNNDEDIQGQMEDE
jgi:hypothetical protein